MGHYLAWAITGPEEGLHTLMDPYDEENNIPGPWPGLSFDYFEVEGHASPGELADRIHRNQDDAPDVLICQAGQIRLASQQETNEEYGMPPLIPGGAMRMMQELAASETSVVYILDWHT